MWQHPAAEPTCRVQNTAARLANSQPSLSCLEAYLSGSTFSLPPLVELDLRLREQVPSEHSQLPFLPSRLLAFSGLQQACSHPMLYTSSCWICHETLSRGDPTAFFMSYEFLVYIPWLISIVCLMPLSFFPSCVQRPWSIVVKSSEMRPCLRIFATHLFLPGCHPSRSEWLTWNAPKLSDELTIFKFCSLYSTALLRMVVLKHPFWSSHISATFTFILVAHGWTDSYNDFQDFSPVCIFPLIQCVRQTRLLANPWKNPPISKESSLMLFLLLVRPRQDLFMCILLIVQALAQIPFPPLNKFPFLLWTL